MTCDLSGLHPSIRGFSMPSIKGREEGRSECSFLSNKIRAVLSLGLYEINSKSRVDLTTFTQNKLLSPLPKVKSAQVTTSY